VEEKMKKIIMIFWVCMVTVSGMVLLGSDGPVKSIYDFKMIDIDGKDVSLDQYKGQVVMIVNVASKCGFTPQYEGLQKIYSRYKDRGFVILGFPANNFREQEPGTNAEIKNFCTVNYGVEFPMFSKISVLGDDMHPLYRFLTGKETNPEFSGDIRWNFDKFLFSKEGKVVARFHPKVKPDSDKIIQTIETELKK
jgi:glutathione peroxidase